MRKILSSIEGEYRRYKSLAGGAISQLSEAELAITSTARSDPAGGISDREDSTTGIATGTATNVSAGVPISSPIGTPTGADTADDHANSVTAIAWHIAGNLRSRFTEFLTTDGEKTWRDRESEFTPRLVTHQALVAFWETGWNILFTALTELTDEDLARTVIIRGQPLSVTEALHRSLAHTSYHVGQIVFLARSIRGNQWSFLSVPPGQTADYNARPTMEKPPGQPAT